MICAWHYCSSKGGGGGILKCLHIWTVSLKNPEERLWISPEIRIDPVKGLHEQKKHIFFLCQQRDVLSNDEMSIVHENFETCLAFVTFADNAPGKNFRGRPFVRIVHTNICVYSMYTVQYNQIRIQHTYSTYCTCIHKHIHVYEYMLLNFLKRRRRIFNNSIQIHDNTAENRTRGGDRREVVGGGMPAYC